MKCGLIGLLETKIKIENEEKAKKRIRRGWKSVFNNTADSNRGRIWIMWDPKRYDVQNIFSSPQIVHCRIKDLEEDK